MLYMILLTPLIDLDVGPARALAAPLDSWALAETLSAPVEGHSSGLRHQGLATLQCSRTQHPAVHPTGHSWPGRRGDTRAAAVRFSHTLRLRRGSPQQGPSSPPGAARSPLRLPTCIKTSLQKYIIIIRRRISLKRAPPECL